MFDFLNDPLNELREFALTHQEALQNISSLLGGGRALRRTQHLLDRVAMAPKLTRYMINELNQLRSFLYFDDEAHNPYGNHPSSDVMPHPETPIIEDICLLSDGFNDVLMRLGEAENIPLLQEGGLL